MPTQSFDHLSLRHKMAVVLMESPEPLSLEALAEALQARGVPLQEGPETLQRAWSGALPIRRRSDGRLEVVRRGNEYANFCRHLQHHLGYVVSDGQAPPPVNTRLPSEWYSPAANGGLLDEAVPEDQPVSAGEVEEASRLASRRLPPNFVRTLCLVWLESHGGQADIRGLVEDLGRLFVHRDVEAIYLSLHTTGAVTTDRDSGIVTLRTGHPDHQGARRRFREWAGQLRIEARQQQLERARLQAYEAQTARARADAIVRFLDLPLGVVLFLPGLGDACGGLYEPAHERCTVFKPADSDAFREALKSLRVVVGVDGETSWKRLGLPTDGCTFIDIGLSNRYVAVGRNRRRVQQEDAMTFTLGVAADTEEALQELWRRSPQQWRDRVVAQLHLLYQWYEYGRQHDYVLAGSGATQTVPVQWNPGQLPAMHELVDEARATGTPLEASLRGAPHLFRPMVVTGETVWWLDTGAVERLDLTRLFSVRRPVPAPAVDESASVTVAVTRVDADVVAGIRLADNRPVVVRPIQYEGGIVAGEVLDLVVRDGSRGSELEAVVIDRWWDLSHLDLSPPALMGVGDWLPEEGAWSTAGETVPLCLRPVLEAGVRPAFEMERLQVSSGPDPDAAARDEADQGNLAAAAAHWHRMLAADLRFLDALAGLGGLWFQHAGPHGLEVARRRYELGVELGQQDWPGRFDGVLLWADAGNRPWLRCLYGLGLCQWRQGQFEAAVETFTRLLWLNPPDELGAHYALPLVQKRIPWTPVA